MTTAHSFMLRPYSALNHKLWIQSSAPEDGQNYLPKHVELIEIINKIIIVASSWRFILLYQWCTVTRTSYCQIIWFQQKNEVRFNEHAVLMGQ